MRSLLWAAFVFCWSWGAVAQNYTMLTGTYEVSFQPMQSGGRVEGCSLVFRAVALDHVYQQGSPAMIVGNVTYFASRAKSNAAMSLKLGLRTALTPKATPTAPAFAYLQTASANTAKSAVDSGASDAPGYKVFVYRLDDAALKVIQEMLTTDAVTIGFNRTPGGLHVMVPLDLTVERTDFKGGELLRRRSPDAVLGFTSCVVDLTKQLR
jgi:hypothetical protein